MVRANKITGAVQVYDAKSAKWFTLGIPEKMSFIEKYGGVE
jgi:hypothetical protein